MSYIVNFKEVETTGLETSPVADVLAGLRANEARYFHNKYKIPFEVFTPEEKTEILPFIEKVLADSFCFDSHSPDYQTPLHTTQHSPA